MFTGLIEQQGDVLVPAQEGVGSRLVIGSEFTDLNAGESIAVNGVCLTLLSDFEQGLAFDLSPETLALTNLSGLKKGDKVNLERAMRANTRFGGHYVSGHVDTRARIKALQVLDEYLEVSVSDFEKPAMMYLLPKGSITLDGISLTINAVIENTIKLMLVPHTMAETTFGKLAVGQRINVEFDYLTRIVAHQLEIAGQLKKEVD